MPTVLAMIMAGGKGERLHPLTLHRAKPAVPFGGKYRIIDFTLSNCINSHVRRIVVIAQYKSLSLDRHLALGWERPDASLAVQVLVHQLRAMGPQVVLPDLAAAFGKRGVQALIIDNAPTGDELRSELRKRAALNRAVTEAPTEPELLRGRPLNATEIVVVRKILSCVARMNGRFGKGTIAAVLRGSKSSQVAEHKLERLSTYGLLRDMTQDDIGLYVKALMQADCIAAGKGLYPTVSLTDFGREVMAARAEVLDAVREETGRERRRIDPGSTVETERERRVEAETLRDVSEAITRTPRLEGILAARRAPVAPQSEAARHDPEQDEGQGDRRIEMVPQALLLHRARQVAGRHLGREQRPEGRIAGMAAQGERGQQRHEHERSPRGKEEHAVPRLAQVPQVRRPDQGDHGQVLRRGEQHHDLIGGDKRHRPQDLGP